MRYTICLFLITYLIEASFAASTEGKISFTAVTEEAGIQFQHVDGRSGQRYFLETVGSGVAFFDYDDDGLLDIYFVNSADLPGSHSPTPPTNRLYHNNGDSTFTDVTERAGVGDIGYGAGCAAADYDNDGDLDLYVTNFGANVLYRNNGDSTFTDVTQHAGVGNNHWSLGCAFADYDRDGFVDLYVTLTTSTLTLKRIPTAHKKGWRPTVHRKVSKAHQTPYITTTAMGLLPMLPPPRESTIKTEREWGSCLGITTTMEI